LGVARGHARGRTGAAAVVGLSRRGGSGGGARAACLSCLIALLTRSGVTHRVLLRARAGQLVLPAEETSTRTPGCARVMTNKQDAHLIISSRFRLAAGGVAGDWGAEGSPCCLESPPTTTARSVSAHNSDEAHPLAAAAGGSPSRLHVKAASAVAAGVGLRTRLALNEACTVRVRIKRA
jgi:hypothetical protein